MLGCKVLIPYPSIIFSFKIEGQRTWRERWTKDIPPVCMILSHYPTDPTLHVFVLSSSTTLFIKRKKQQRRRRRQLTKTFINNTITALWQMLRVMLTWIAQCALWLVTKKKKARGTLNQSWNATRQTQLQIDSKNFAALRPVSHMIFWNFTASHCCLFVCPFVSVTFSWV